MLLIVSVVNSNLETIFIVWVFSLFWNESCPTKTAPSIAVPPFIFNEKPQGDPPKNSQLPRSPLGATATATKPATKAVAMLILPARGMIWLRLPETVLRNRAIDRDA